MICILNVLRVKKAENKKNVSLSQICVHENIVQVYT